LLERLAAMGYQDLTGVDIRPPASGGSIRYRQADLDCFRLEVPDGAFDLALAVEVIEHIENPGLFLVELARLLRPGGIGVFTTPNLHSAQAKLLFGLTDRLKQFDSKGDPTHIMPIVLFPFTRLLNRHGFTVLKSWGFPEDGSSPTSRPLMRLAARLLRPIVRTPITHGDTLCLLIQRQDASLSTDPTRASKVALLTSHY
jgi:SAM-dependent methyltransferase